MSVLRRSILVIAASLVVAAPAWAQVPSALPPFLPPVPVPTFPEPPADEEPFEEGPLGGEEPSAEEQPLEEEPLVEEEPVDEEPPAEEEPQDDGPVAPPRSAGPFAWAVPSARALDRLDIWPGASALDLSAPATRADLARVLVGIAERIRSAPPTGSPLAQAVRAGWMTAPGGSLRPGGPVTVADANRAVVLMLGLRAERRALAALSTADGIRLRTPRGFADAVLAREAGLHHNYPTERDDLELSSTERIRRADLAGMAAAALELDGWRRERLGVLATISLPALTTEQRAVIEAALSYVGQPYVWGGDWTTPASPWGGQAHGGFDCSGLVWMALKGTRGTRALEAGSTLGGRTADDMAWEAPRVKVARERVAPADLLFFGDRGPRTRRGAISHMGIAMGSGWMVHSSGSRGGVSVTHLGDYWSDGLAWGRRVV